MGAWWDKEKTLWLVTPKEFEKLPDGFCLTSICGEKVRKGIDYIDDDTRFGHLAYGAGKEAIEAAIAGRPLEPDEGGLDVEVGHLYDALTRIVDEMEYEAGNGHIALRIAKEALEKK